jgi:hypothetical protein
MKRMIVWSLGVLLLAAPLFAGDKSAAKSQSATGTVTAVSAGSLTLKGKDGEQTFAAGKWTVVIARGASHKMAAMEAENRPALLTDFIDVGADVTVKYQEMDGTRRAAKVSVYRSPAWSNGGRAPQWAPSQDDYGAFMMALARRYDGVTPDRLGRAHGPVEMFQAWNEPNFSRFLMPQWRTDSRGRQTSASARVTP